MAGPGSLDAPEKPVSVKMHLILQVGGAWTIDSNEGFIKMHLSLQVGCGLALDSNEGYVTTSKIPC